MRTRSTDHDVVTPAESRRAEPTLAELMSGLAQRLSFNVALGICAAAVVGLAIVIAFAPTQWRLALALAAAASAGAWTMSDHERRASPTGLARRWKMLQGVSAILGMASIFALLLAFLSTALGLWIS